ncbi:MAG: DUF4350 domain-containing protein [Chloracidobacterium sp.]|nr:DUF4350 domain-containing protein [Chloracidobacterium sp.]
MKQRLLLLAVFVFLITVLVGLNAASYQQKEKTPDSELAADRSSYNSGSTGTQAYYSLLTETGRKAVRWQEPPSSLLTSGSAKPNVFVLIGRLKRELTDEEAESLLRWVSEGGRLVIIDREPPAKLATTTANWRIIVSNQQVPALLTVDPADQQQMIAETAAVKPVQPTTLTESIVAVQPSRFSSSISAVQFPGGDEERTKSPASPAAEPSHIAPLIHFPLADDGLVIDAPFGSGKIVFVADPYIVSNGGIALADNARLGINLVSVKDGIIAFDEYHHGFGSDRNRFLQFFAGTPIIGIFLQAAFLAGLIFYSRSRRFARPVPEPEPDRLSKLEYVTAMAELQRRTNAYDLAVENIYTDARVRICRTLGLDTMAAKPREIAVALVERIGGKEDEYEATLFKCEEIIRGEPTGKREVLSLIAALRDVEQKLGVRRIQGSKDAG